MIGLTIFRSQQIFAEFFVFIFGYIKISRENNKLMEKQRKKVDVELTYEANHEKNCPI